MKGMKILTAALAMLVMVFGVMPSANAIPYVIDGSALALTPYTFYSDTASGNLDNSYYALNAGGVYYGYQTSNKEVVSAATRILGGIYPEVYKGEETESGTLAGSYDTDMVNTHTWEIKYTGNSYVVNPYVLVKDGNADPSWFLLSTTWNGKDDLVIQNFFVPAVGRDGGGISHVSFLGTISVPEPSTLLLLGLGLVGLAGTRRKIKK